MRISVLIFLVLLTLPGSAVAVNLTADGWLLGSGLYQDQCGLLHHRGARPSLETDIGSTPGAGTSPAVYLRGDGAIGSGFRERGLRNSNDEALPAQWSFVRHGGLERSLSMQAWRGQRVRLSLRLKNEDEARAFAAVQVDRSNDTALRSVAQRNEPGSGGWQLHQFVLDVPDNATDMTVMVGLTGQGTIWLDGFEIGAIHDDAATTTSYTVTSESRPGCTRYIGPVMAIPGQAQRGPSFNYQMYGR